MSKKIHNRIQSVFRTSYFKSLDKTAKDRYFPNSSRFKLKYKDQFYEAAQDFKSFFPPKEQCTPRKLFDSFMSYRRDNRKAFKVDESLSLEERAQERINAEIIASNIDDKNSIISFASQTQKDLFMEEYALETQYFQCSIVFEQAVVNQLIKDTASRKSISAITDFER